MSIQFLLAIKITIIGIGLAFLTIGLMWLFMRGFVNIFTVSEKETETEAEKKEIAAIIATSIALAERDHLQASKFPLPPTATVSAWQAVLRSNILSKRGHIR